MENNKKVYWKGIEQLNNEPEFRKYVHKEFPEYLPINGESNDNSGSSRRDFLKLMGFSLAAASLAACEAPVRRAIPYLNKPVDIDPGIANYYASTYVNGGDYCSILVKTREGRPIKVEGNKLSKVSGGGTSPQVEASVLSLYDKERLTDPYIGELKSTWEELDNQVKTKLESINSRGEKVAIVSKTILSPTTLKTIEGLQVKYPNIEVVVYDPISANGLLKANEVSFGKRTLPSYQFDRVEVVVSFAADFLGTWISPIKYSSDFAKTRKLKGEKNTMSRLYSFESNLSITGANADYRIAHKASKEGILVANLYNEILKKAGLPTIRVSSVPEAASIQKAANDLWKSQGKSLVISGSNDENIQILVNKINDLLGNYGETIDLKNYSNFRNGDDSKMDSFISELKTGKTKGVIFFNCNPVYDHPRGAEIAEGIAKAELKVSTSDRKDETTSLVEYIAPDHHLLESWNDAEPVRGHYSFTQPAISQLFNTRQAGETFLRWSGNSQSYLEFLMTSWKEGQFSRQTSITDFQTFWDKCLHDGIYSEPVSEVEEEEVKFSADIQNVLDNVSRNYKVENENPELVFYTKIAIGDGSQANNPWLQEMSDAISKACWDNYLTVTQTWAEDNNVKMVESQTKYALLKVGSQEFKLPILVQPGQAEGTFGLALGYGRTNAGKVANGIGVNAFPLIAKNNNYYSLARFESIEISASDEVCHIAQTQTHHTFMSRTNVIQESTLSEYQKDPAAGREHPRIATSTVLAKELGLKKGDVPPGALSLWKGHEYPNHHWAMAIDLNSCIGCGTCTISCQAENNVPVVGKQEVINRREMHWIRIDRYYSSDADKNDRLGQEIPSDKPEITFMPMMCQQCNNAPCETVCPVAATTHSTEGLNQMVYNRCIGTRYCANNCPFKVRRFNWFKYHDNKQFDTNLSMNNDLGKMVLNPDVTVRSRGVMEKCTFCVQRIQAGKLEAKKEGRRPVDGEITTACASACPTNAIVFGDLKDPESKIVKLLQFKEEEKFQKVEEPRAYNVLEEINVKPNIWYFTKIRNKDEEIV